MNSRGDPALVSPSEHARDGSEITIPQLVGKIFEAAPTSERCRMLDYLIKPLGALALVGVCNGLFTKLWFRSGWHNFQMRPEDADTVRSIDVIALVEYVQQVNVETINGLVALLTTSPMMTYSASAAMLVTLLLRHARARQSTS